MKWFTTTNEESLSSDNFFRQLQVAVLSARRNTSLEPYLIYDGGEHQRLSWLQGHGVQVLRYRLPYRDQLREFMYATCAPQLLPKLFHVRIGAHLKTEVPAAVKQYGFRDKFVLYTDCDIVFLRDLSLEGVAPRYLAAHGMRQGGWTRFRIGGWMHFNTGILLMNVNKMHDETRLFREFVLANGAGVDRPPGEFMQKNLFLSDQVAVNVFYRGRIDQLGAYYNWHPARGVDSSVRVVHFSGIKWTEWDDLDPETLSESRKQQFRRLIGPNRTAFSYYVERAKCFLDNAPAGLADA